MSHELTLASAGGAVDKVMAKLAAENVDAVLRTGNGAALAQMRQ